MPPLRKVSRATADEVSARLAVRVEGVFEVNPNALDVHGDCPRILRWPTLHAQVVQHFGLITDPLARLIKTRVFEMRLDKVNVAFYRSE